MRTIQQQTIDALATIGYNSARVIDGIGTPSFILEATNADDRAVAISLIDEQTHCKEYFEKSISRAVDSGYRTIIFAARTPKAMDLFDAFDFHERHDELSFSWMIL